MKIRPITGVLGVRQQQILDGPMGPPMQKFECKGCGRTYFDTGLYFYGTGSVKCTWCTKFPKTNGRKKD
jgi:hypothetical protein